MSINFNGNILCASLWISQLFLSFTLVQNKFYFFPSLPFFAIAFAFLIFPYLKAVTINIDFFKNSTYIKIGTLLLFSSTLLFCVFQINKFNRDELILKDVSAIIQHSPRWWPQDLAASIPLFGVRLTHKKRCRRTKIQSTHPESIYKASKYSNQS